MPYYVRKTEVNVADLKLNVKIDKDEKSGKLFAVGQWVDSICGKLIYQLVTPVFSEPDPVALHNITEFMEHRFLNWLRNTQPIPDYYAELYPDGSTGLILVELSREPFSDNGKVEPYLHVDSRHVQ